MPPPKTQFIVPAAGRGERLGVPQPKALIPLGGEPLLARTLRVLSSVSLVDSLIVAVGASWMAEAQELVAGLSLPRRVLCVRGGETRSASVAQAVKALDPDTAFVGVHDAARPLVPRTVVEQAITLCYDEKAVIAGLPVTSTLKRVDPETQVIEATLNRTRIWEAQTPQVFARSWLEEAHQQVLDVDVTDDASLVERLGYAVQVIPGHEENIKITTRHDWALAEAILLRRAVDKGGGMIRVGLGYDVHRLTKGRKLFLGGVEIPHEQGLEGHSDADVLLHAVCDALLGAIGRGDIGEHFSNQDERYRGIASGELLKQVGALVTESGYAVGNIDALVMAEAPKILPFKKQMQKFIAQALSIDEGAVNIKATTGEGLGFVGRREGMAAYATAAVHPRLSGDL